jgi:hypothetical protein
VTVRTPDERLVWYAAITTRHRDQLDNDYLHSLGYSAVISEYRP